MTEPQPVDPEVAAVTFAAHLDDFFKHGRGRGKGWERIDLDPLHIVVRVPAVRADGTRDHYFILLGAEYYDVWPPTVAFVQPVTDGGWEPAADGTRWWPRQNNSPGFAFGLHPAYTYPGGRVGQLLCFSHTLEYYLSNHTPGDAERWRQGTHRVSATLSRIAQVLHGPNYVEPSGDPDS